MGRLVGSQLALPERKIAAQLELGRGGPLFPWNRCADGVAWRLQLGQPATLPWRGGWKAWLPECVAVGSRYRFSGLGKRDVPASAHFLRGSADGFGLLRNPLVRVDVSVVVNRGLHVDRTGTGTARDGRPVVLVRSPERLRSGVS